MAEDPDELLPPRNRFSHVLGLALLGSARGPPAMPKLGALEISDACLAALYRARVYAQQIIDGSLAPVNGARGIWLDAWNECFNIVDEGSDLINELRSFVGLTDEWDEHQDLPNMTDEVRTAHAEIRAEAEAVIRIAATEYLRLFAESGLR